MDLLLTGDLANLAEELCKQLGDDNRIVLASKNIGERNLYKKPATFSFSPNDPLFSKLFNSYSFDVVIFLVKRGEQSGQKTGSIEDLDNCLQLCAKNKVSQVIIVSSGEVYAGNDIIDERSTPAPKDNNGFILAAGESLSKYYRMKSGLNTVVIHVPYLYGESVTDSLLTSVYSKASKKEMITFPGTRYQQCDFIKDTDLVALIAKLIEEGYDLPQGVINIGSGSPITFDELGKLLQREMPDLEFSFLTEPGCVPPPLAVDSARRYYSWIAMNKISDQMRVTIKRFAKDSPEKKTPWQLIAGKLKDNNTLFRVIEIVLGFALMQFLNNLSATSVQYRYVDFRLLFVVVISSINGMRTGLLAVLLAYASCLLSYAGSGLDWRLLFYNADNWLPFIAYLVVGIVTGYVKEKSVSALEMQKAQMHTVEERYVFLYELYDQTLKNKQQYKNQLLSYRDSFGRIYAITKRLDNILPDAVMHEAVVILEDLLENQSIAIYTVNPDCNFARLVVSSKGLCSKSGNSLNLAQYSLMAQELRRDEIWVNKEFLENYPAYCAPIFDHEQIVALIMIYEARYEQMTTYYYNLIKVLCGLIQASLVRAVDYNVAIEEKIYIEGTRILQYDRFEDILAVKQKMKDNSVADFELFRIDNYYSDIRILSNIVSQGIRSTDVIGRGRDGYIYLILTQMEQESIDAVLERLEQNGIHCTLAKGMAAADRMMEA